MISYLQKKFTIQTVKSLSHEYNKNQQTHMILH